MLCNPRGKSAAGKAEAPAASAQDVQRTHQPRFPFLRISVYAVGLGIAQPAVERSVTRARRLYEQGADAIRIDEYVRRWCAETETERGLFRSRHTAVVLGRANARSKVEACVWLGLVEKPNRRLNDAITRGFGLAGVGLLVEVV